MQSADDLIIQKFVRSGFSNSSDTDLLSAAQAFERKASATGASWPLFLSESVMHVIQLLQEHAEYGGVRMGFLEYLDGRFRERLAVIEAATDNSEAARLSKELRDEITTLLSAYDPSKGNGL